MSAEQRQLRKYEKIWLLIAANTSGKPVRVRCVKEFQRTLIQAVKKEKARVNAPRKKVDAVFHGKLVIEQHDDCVLFSLSYNGDHI